MIQRFGEPGSYRYHRLQRPIGNHLAISPIQALRALHEADTACRGTDVFRRSHIAVATAVDDISQTACVAWQSSATFSSLRVQHHQGIGPLARPRQRADPGKP
jgi:hypothetical protein